MTHYVRADDLEDVLEKSPKVYSEPPQNTWTTWNSPENHRCGIVIGIQPIAEPSAEDFLRAWIKAENPHEYFLAKEKAIAFLERKK